MPITWNSADKAADIRLSQQDRQVNSVYDGGFRNVRSVAHATTGKYIFAARLDSKGGGDVQLGLCDSTFSLTTYGSNGGSSIAYFQNGAIYGVAGSSSGPTYGPADEIAVAANFDTHKVWFAKNGIWVNGDPVAGTGGTALSAANLYGLCGVSGAQSQWTAIDPPVTAGFARMGEVAPVTSAGTGAATLGSIGGSSVSAIALKAASGGMLGGLVAQAAGKALLVAAGAATLQPITGAAPVRLGVSGTAATTLGEVAGAASATRTPVLSASTFATLAPIASSATGQAVITGAASSSLGQVDASGVGAATIAAAGTSTVGAIKVVSTGRAQVAGVAANQLGAIVGVAQAGAQASLVASAASVLADVAATSSGQAPISAAGSVGLHAVTSSSTTAAAPVRAAAATPIGEIVGVSVGRLAVSAVGAAQIAALGSVAATRVVVRAIVSAALSPVSGTARGYGDDTGLGGDPSPGWTARVTPRRFTGSAARRRFTALSTGCTRMITYPAKSAREVRHASVDFRPDLASSETLVGIPTITVVRGTVGIAAKRIEGTEVRFTLSGGSTSPTAIQRLEVSCSTSAGQVLEETVSMTIRSDA